MSKRSSLRIESGMKSSMNVRDWSNLPSDLIVLILEKLHFNFVDVIRFGAVCKPWHNITVNKPLNSLPPQPPWLLLSSPDTEIETPFRFRNIFEDKIYTLPPPPYPTTSSIHSCSSRSSVNGWLFLFKNGTECSFVNPLTKQQVVLPPISRSNFLPRTRQYVVSQCRERGIKSVVRKAVFSSPPNEQNCLVMAITSIGFPRLMFCKVGDKGWKPIKEIFSVDSFSGEPFEDAIYFNGLFYAVDSYGKIVACDLTASSPVCEQVRAPNQNRLGNTFLVDVSGELVFIVRVKQERSGNISFHLFQQDSTTKQWISVRKPNHTIFLGFNQSVSLLASNYSGFKGNRLSYPGEDYQRYDSKKIELGDSRTEFQVWVVISPW